MSRPLGWLRPQEHHYTRLKFRSAAPSSVLDSIDPAPTSNNYRLCTVLDQGSLGSCTANATAQVIHGTQVRDYGAGDIASRLALYYWARYQDGNQGRDVGSHICTVFDVAAELGLPSETVYPYDVAKFAEKPGPSVYRHGYDQRGSVGLTYEQLSADPDAFIDQLERALTAGYLVAFGVDVSERFCSELPTGVVEPPVPPEPIAGGHALTAIGHDHDQQWIEVLNSWGPDWCEPGRRPGCFRMSYDYLRLSDDRWFCPLAPKPEVSR